MKWPFVSRALLDEAHRRIADEQARHEQQMEAARADLRVERERYDALLDQFTRLRVAGAVGGPPIITEEMRQFPVAPVPKADDLRDLVHEKFGHDPRRLKMALAQLRIDRAAGVEGDAIRSAILNGVEGNGVPA